MIENGLVLLVNASSQVQAIVPSIAGQVQGGFPFGQVSQNQPLPTWEFRFFGGTTFTGLLFYNGLQWRRWEIGCLGDTAGNAINLANAINSVVQGFSGRLPDQTGSPLSAGTLVDSIFVENSPQDFFNDAARSYRRVLEYRVTFNPLA